MLNTDVNGWKEITSVQNPHVKHLLALSQKSALRRSEGLFVVEGRREVGHCIDAGMQIDTLYVCREMLADDDLLSRVEPQRVVAVGPAVYARMAYREGTEGVVATVRERRLTLEQLSLPPDALLMVVESVEKPGNLGAIMRSADAAGAHAVIVCDEKTDLWNPNLIRASLGSVFTVPCVACSSAQCIEFLKRRGIAILTAQLQDSLPYYDTDMRGPTALVMGTESTGLTQQWRQAATAHLRIPMLGRLDSLNVSVSAAVLLYEAVRQRLQARQRHP